MIVSDNQKKSNWRWLQACFLPFAMAVLALGIASGQVKVMRLFFDCTEISPVIIRIYRTICGFY